jgi:hypothetical protein
VEMAELEVFQVGAGCEGHGINLKQGRGNANGAIQKGISLT